MNESILFINPQKCFLTSLHPYKLPVLITKWCFYIGIRKDKPYFIASSLVFINFSNVFSYLAVCGLSRSAGIILERIQSPLPAATSYFILKAALPFCFTLYNATSALLHNEIKSSPCSGNAAPPALADKCTCSPVARVKSSIIFWNFSI